MKIKNTSQTYAYCFKQDGRFVGVLPGATVEVPKGAEDSVKRLCDVYAKNPETAVFTVVPDSAKVSPVPAELEETEDEKQARVRLEERQAASAEKQKKADERAAQKAQEEARLSNEKASEGVPPNVVRGADGKPIQVIK